MIFHENFHKELTLSLWYWWQRVPTWTVYAHCSAAKHYDNTWREHFQQLSYTSCCSVVPQCVWHNELLSCNPSSVSLHLCDTTVNLDAPGMVNIQDSISLYYTEIGSVVNSTMLLLVLSQCSQDHLSTDFSTPRQLNFARERPERHHNYHSNIFRAWDRVSQICQA